MTAEIVSLATYRAAKRPSGDHRESGFPFGEGFVERRKHPRDEECWVEHRCEPRHVVDGQCAPRIIVGGSAARLENVSRDGLMATAAVREIPGSRIIVSIAGCRPLSGRIRWKRGGLVGLEVPIGSMELR